MKLKYKHQGFQAEACRMVVNVFTGQPKSDEASDFLIDPGKNKSELKFLGKGFGNQKILLKDETIEENVRAVQNEQGLKPIEQLEGDKRTFTIEMETGTGKTYTYIKTMYELNAHYGWRKFIIVVPSIAIREGVCKSFESMENHFAEEYDGKRIQYFIYNSNQLNKIRAFAEDPGLYVMIINAQAFNTDFKSNANKGNARIIFSQRDDFGSRKPIDTLSATHPILIIDEPQSVLGANKENATRKGLRLFKPLFTLLYSATHRKEDIYNMVYRLDAIDAYNKKLVKKIEVKGINQVGSTATNGYLYLDEIKTGKGNPQARISFDRKNATGLVIATQKVDEGFNLKENSGNLAEYEDNYVIERIDGIDRTVRLLNGIVLHEGDAIGKVNEDVIRRIQIRETIRTHIERERQLFHQHIKVLSLFFIDHVNSYREYDKEDTKGKFALMFEEEYRRVLQEMIPTFDDVDYLKYLEDPRNSAEKVHQGYFSQDKKGKVMEIAKKEEDQERTFDLIMKDKERLLSMEEPIRFIFSHSALKEGWDNPNVFQICTLKNSDNETKKRQEVGRGMRLCVNNKGERQDQDVLGSRVFDTNILTVIASESYESFANQLQTEIADACTNRPMNVTPALFTNARVEKANGTSYTLTEEQATEVQECLIKNSYVEKGKLSNKYFEDKRNGTLDFGDEIDEDWKEMIIEKLDSIANPDKLKPEDGRKKQEAHFNSTNFEKKEFQELWKRINAKTYYQVDFNTEELIKNAKDEIDSHLKVTQIRIEVETGSLDTIPNKEALEAGTAIKKKKNEDITVTEAVGDSVKYDLIGKLVANTGLTRRTIITILQKIKPETFNQFKCNPEEFILKTSRIINDCKAMKVIEAITYTKSDNTFGTDIFTASTLRGTLGKDAIESTKSLYDLVVVDSEGIEKKFAESLEKKDNVKVYTKLPNSFYINTPMGHYNPDWAITYYENGTNYVYFVAETKGNSLESSQLRGSEESKIACARKHFAAINTQDLKYDVVKDYNGLYNAITGNSQK